MVLFLKSWVLCISSKFCYKIWIILQLISPYLYFIVCRYRNYLALLTFCLEMYLLKSSSLLGPFCIFPNTSGDSFAKPSTTTQCGLPSCQDLVTTSCPFSLINTLFQALPVSAHCPASKSMPGILGFSHVSTSICSCYLLLHSRRSQN